MSDFGLAFLMKLWLDTLSEREKVSLKKGTKMFTSEISWYEGTRVVSHETLSAHLGWLTNLYDATGQAPDVFDSNGNQIKIKYTARGNAQVAE
jgi:hypothetical protein